MQWLWYSLVASVVLTVVANGVVRLWPGATGRGIRRLDEWTEQRREQGGEQHRRPASRVHVIVPWRAMLVVSVIATVVLNLVLWLA